MSFYSFDALLKGSLITGESRVPAIRQRAARSTPAKPLQRLALRLNAGFLKAGGLRTDESQQRFNVMRISGT